MVPIVLVVNLLFRVPNQNVGYSNNVIHASISELGAQCATVEPTIDCTDPESVCFVKSDLTQVPTDKIPPTTKAVDPKGNDIKPTIDCTDPESACFVSSNLTQVPTDKIPPTTKTVDLKGNDIAILSYNSFSGLVNVETLVLSSNKVQTIQTGTFKDQGKLLYLDLGENSLLILKGDFWVGLDSLNTLRISGNPIRNMTSLGFSNLPKMKLVLIDLTTLESLHEELANPTNYPETLKQPKLGLEDDTDLTCNDTMCWLKRLEDKGLMAHYNVNGRLTRPRCQNKTMFWDEFSETLSCSGKNKDFFTRTIKVTVVLYPSKMDSTPSYGAV